MRSEDGRLARTPAVAAELYGRVVLPPMAAPGAAVFFPPLERQDVHLWEHGRDRQHALVLFAPDDGLLQLLCEVLRRHDSQDAGFALHQVYNFAQFSRHQSRLLFSIASAIL
jgi:hypothetical protein